MIYLLASNFMIYSTRKLIAHDIMLLFWIAFQVQKVITTVLYYFLRNSSLTADCVYRYQATFDIQ